MICITFSWLFDPEIKTDLFYV